MQLSQEQSKAVLTESKRALCLAGAGSGKTRVLISRVQNLVENRKVSPHEILLATFTRKAAGEMRDRLEKSIGNSAYNVTIGTIHSVALNMIQRFGEFIGLNPGKITVYSDWEEGILLKNVCVELGYHTGKTWKSIKKKDVEKAFYLFYTEGKRDSKTHNANEIMDAFFARCRENNALTYGTILTSFRDLLPKISHLINYRHVLIDEIQDNDSLQWQIINKLCELCGASLFVVGDPDQSIFEFRGADPEYLIRHQEEFDIYKLEDNYRSDMNIVDAANKLISNNISRLDNTMIAKRGRSNEVVTISNIDSSEMCERLKVNPDGESVTVLARNHYLLKKLSVLLKESEIDHDYVGSKTSFTRSEMFRRVHAFLKLSVNPFDNFSFLVIRDHIEIPDYMDIRMKAAKEDKSHFQVWAESDHSSFPWIIEYIKTSKERDFPGIVELLEKLDFGFDAVYVFRFITEYLKNQFKPSIEAYLNWLAIYDVQDEITEDSKNIQLMTIHASKGLEFPTVVIAGMNDGILPSSRAKEKHRELESERRLAYVAYTRARDHLILTSRPVDKEAKIKQLPSRFIKESV